VDSTVAVIVALAGVVTGVGGLFASWRTSRASARKDEVDALRGIIEELRRHDDAQSKEMTKQARQLGRLAAEVRTWKRRFERVCERFGVNPNQMITGRLGPLPEGEDGIGSGTQMNADERR